MQELYCLGYLEDNKWKCKYWNVKSSKWMMGFDVTEDGTYAVIFYPSIDASKVRQGIYCGLFCKDARLIY